MKDHNAVALGRRDYFRDYKRDVRQRIYPQHEYVKANHCRSCNNEYMRQRRRARSKVTLSPAV